jgi:flagellar hook protein FlgE
MVSTALFTGLTGLRAEQSYIDVIGNNLANVSTAGFRASRATFSDILSFTLTAGSGPNGNFGGTDPMQIGHGTVVSTVDTDTSQGTFQDTGRPLDVALQGRGFFTLTNGLQQFYTRVGSFGIDSSHNLVDLRSGLHVMNAAGGNITVPVTDTLPARATSSISFQGNLPARVTGPLEEIVESSAAFKAGTAAHERATGTAGSGNQFNLGALAGRSVLVSINGGAQQTVTFPNATFGAGPVNASVVANAFQVAGLAVTANDAAGTIDFDTVKLGTSATLKFDDGPSATGLLTALGLNATLVTGSESPAIDTTDLAQLTARNNPYANGDRITVSGTNADGSVFSNTFVYGAGNNGTTVRNLLDFINTTTGGSQETATLTTDGHIRFTTVNKGPANLSLFLGDAAGNTGSTNFPNFAQTQDGTGPDTAVSSIDVIDSQGRTHPVSLTFTRTTADPTIWDLKATMDASEGTITNDTVSQVRFNANGSFNVIGGGNNSLSFQWNGLTQAQAVTVNLGTNGQFDGVAMLGNTATVAATDQDGFAPGTLLNVAFDPKGNLTGFYSNGQSQVLSTLRISMFSNEAGLLRAGTTMFVQSPNSDDAIATTSGTAGAGSVRPGSLENSNVDIAREFVNLIEAQRGFQANSRVITTADQILAELMNVIH